MKPKRRMQTPPMTGDGVDDGCYFSDEGEDDGEDGCASDDPGAVDAGHGHDAHVFTVGGVRGGADEAGDHVGEAVCEEGSVETRVFDEVSAYDVAGDEEVAQVFGEYDEDGREDHHDGGEVEGRRIEGRRCEPCDFFDVGEVNDAHGDREEVAGNDANQDRDDGDESAAKDGSEDGDDQGEHGNNDGCTCAHALRVSDEAGHAHGKRGEFKADDGYDGAHGCRREEDVYPFDACFLDDEGEEHEAQAEGDEASLRVCVGHACGRGDGEDWRNESEGGAEVSRKSPFADGEVNQCADAVHEKAGRGVDVQEERDEDGRTEHGK